MCVTTIACGSRGLQLEGSAIGGIRAVKSHAANAVIEDQTTMAWADGEAERKASAPLMQVTDDPILASRTVRLRGGSVQRNGCPAMVCGEVFQWARVDV